MEKGRRRWIVDISKWNPSEDHFSSIVSLLPRHDRSAVTRFIRSEDRKRALVTRLLQYTLVHEVFCLPFDKIVIDRTVEGKPYLKNAESVLFPNFTFNASHNGNYVGIASEPLYLVGFDIVSNDIPFKEAVLDFVNHFAVHFTTSEWKEIMKFGNPYDSLTSFYRYWSLKEAFVKATGAGLGFGLQRLEFHHCNWTNICIRIDGMECRDWRFWQFELDQQHWASVAWGHPRSASESFKKTLSRVDFELEECWNELQLPEEGFTIRTVEDLIPNEALKLCLG